MSRLTPFGVCPMPKPIREPRVFPDVDLCKAAHAVAVAADPKSKEKVFSLKTKQGKESHVLATSSACAVMDYARHVGISIVCHTPGTRNADPLRAAKKRISTMTPEQRAELLALLQGDAPAPAEPAAA